MGENNPARKQIIDLMWHKTLAAHDGKNAVHVWNASGKQREWISEREEEKDEGNGE